MEALEHEKFESIKELADIQAKISEGRSLLASLEEHKEEFLANRAKELSLRIKQTLSDSRDYLADINKYHDELVKYRKQTDSYVESLRYFSELVFGISKEIHRDIDGVVQYLSESEEKIKKGREEVKQGFSQVKDEQNALQIKEGTLKKEEIKLKDGQATLQRAIERLKKQKV